MLKENDTPTLPEYSPNYFNVASEKQCPDSTALQVKVFSYTRVQDWNEF